MKIAGLIPVKICPEKSHWMMAAEEAAGVCDCVIVLDDHSHEPLPAIPPVTELLRVQHSDGQWNDYVNRLTLLARAAKYGCEYAMWLDDDETLGPSLTRDHVHYLCKDMHDRGATEGLMPIRTAWNGTQWRTDGEWGKDSKTFITRNPFMDVSVEWIFSPEKQLHHFPIIKGTHPITFSDDYIIHWGMCSPRLRELRQHKYRAIDPQKQFYPQGYDYLTDETGITLEDL